MRKTIVSLCLLVGMSVVALQAQTEISTNALIELIRSDVRTQKVAIIGQAMNFAEGQDEKFWPIYKEYDAELVKLGDSYVAILKDYAKNYESMTEEKAAQLTQATLNIHQKRLDLKTKYHKRLAIEMSPIVAARFLQIDNQLGIIIDLQIASEVPLIKKP